MAHMKLYKSMNKQMGFFNKKNSIFKKALQKFEPFEFKKQRTLILSFFSFSFLFLMFLGKAAPIVEFNPTVKNSKKLLLQPRGKNPKS